MIVGYLGCLNIWCPEISWLIIIVAFKIAISGYHTLFSDTSISRPTKTHERTATIMAAKVHTEL